MEETRTKTSNYINALYGAIFLSVIFLDTLAYGIFIWIANSHDITTPDYWYISWLVQMIFGFAFLGAGFAFYCVALCWEGPKESKMTYRPIIVYIAYTLLLAALIPLTLSIAAKKYEDGLIIEAHETLSSFHSTQYAILVVVITGFFSLLGLLLIIWHVYNQYWKETPVGRYIPTRVEFTSRHGKHL